MALFQVSVLNTYLKLQEEQKLANAFKKFSKYFHNPTIQENIRNSKEEQFQATFLNELFVNVLGYTLNPQPDFNLSTEFKNENNARKADGAILKDGAAIGVIELKGTNTKDLEGIRRQAFDYKVNQKSCVYVITSNFEKLRFYINDATEFLEFDLFLLTSKDFALLYLCLQKENVLKNLPLKIKESSVVKEEQITKEFYNDYSVFKRELYRDLVRLNAKSLKKIRISDPNFSGVEESNLDFAKSQAQVLRLEKNVKLELFKKSQKLIDRFLFIFFAEDRGLLPPNSTIKIVKDWNKLKELDAVVPLYDRFKLYFSYLDKGRKSTDSRAEIFAYNGGLFKPDNLLDRLEINDELLAKHTTQLSKYDFDSQVDVNILGHIFENSLNEIEGVNAEIEGADFDKQKSKRKNDGVFYTPKYITKYIVENTLGKLCEEKKSELGFREEEYYKGRKRRQKETLEGLIKILDDYRAWLLQLTICDPACGSGAFLNQALDFLIKEHRYIDELKAKLLGGGLVFSDIETTILENNIYGVDINEESIEIAKLSLWLRTAQPRRKLNDLNSNIKCGNSLIDDKKVAGDKAFKWEKEFQDIFSNGGFDVIIGNPPYGAKLNKETQDYLNKTYIKGGSETVISFLKLSHDLLKDKGEFGFIIPKAFSFSSNYASIRELLLNEIQFIVDCKKVWNEVKLEQVIVGFTKSANHETYKSLLRNDQEIEEVGNISKNTFAKFGFYLNGISEQELNVGNKLTESKRFLNDIATNQRGGPLQKLIAETGDVRALGGANVQRNGIRGFKGFVNEEEIVHEKRNFVNNKSVLAQNIVSHIQNPIEHIKIIACVPKDKDWAILDTINQITINSSLYNNDFVCTLLNSKIINWYCFRFIYGKAIRTMHFDNAITERIPIPEITKEELSKLLDQIKEVDSFQAESDKLIRTFYQYFSELLLSGVEGTNKLEQWNKKDFKTFLKQLNKLRKDNDAGPFDSEEEYKWFERFTLRKKEVEKVETNLDRINKEIDVKFCELFKLTEFEINLVFSQMP